MTVTTESIPSFQEGKIVEVSHMRQVPSQANEGNLGTLPLNRPSSTLPEIPTLDPLRDFPSTDFFDEDGRQLAYLEAQLSQAIEGNVDELPNPESTFTLPEIQTLDPLKDKLLSKESDQQIYNVNDSSDKTSSEDFDASTSAQTKKRVSCTKLL